MEQPAPEETREMFRGHVEDCLKHLGARLASRVPKGSRGATLAKKPFADFCGVSVDTITRWLNDAQHLPGGEPLIKLLCYLDMVGYRVIEWERIPPSRRNFTELVGYGILSMEKATELLGFSSASTLSQILQGHRGTSDDRERQMWDMWKERKEELEKKKAECRDAYILEALRQLPAVTEPAPKEKLPTVPARHGAVVSIMAGLLALLEERPYETLSESERAEWRGSADTVLRLSARLSALSSQLIMSADLKGGGS